MSSITPPNWTRLLHCEESEHFIRISNWIVSVAHALSTRISLSFMRFPTCYCRSSTYQERAGVQESYTNNIKMNFSRILLLRNATACHPTAILIPTHQHPCWVSTFPHPKSYGNRITLQSLAIDRKPTDQNQLRTVACVGRTWLLFET